MNRTLLFILFMWLFMPMLLCQTVGDVLEKLPKAFSTHRHIITDSTVLVDNFDFGKLLPVPARKSTTQFTLHYRNDTLVQISAMHEPRFELYLKYKNSHLNATMAIYEENTWYSADHFLYHNGEQFIAFSYPFCDGHSVHYQEPNQHHFSTTHHKSFYMIFLDERLYPEGKIFVTNDTVIANARLSIREGYLEEYIAIFKLGAKTKYHRIESDDIKYLTFHQMYKIGVFSIGGNYFGTYEKQLPRGIYYWVLNPN